MSLLEWAAALTGFLSVWLTVRQDIWCWPTGLVNVALYVVVFWQARLYADMGLQVFYAAASLYGWWAWLHGGQAGGQLVVTRTPRAWLLGLLTAGTAFGFGLGLLLHALTDASLPWLDSALTALSLVAQVLMTRKWIENWALWIAVDVAYVFMYLYKGLYPTALLYAVFLGLAVEGLREWRGALARTRAEA